MDKWLIRSVGIEGLVEGGCWLSYCSMQVPNHCHDRMLRDRRLRGTE